jgi:hypothetical protein
MNEQVKAILRVYAAEIARLTAAGEINPIERAEAEAAARSALMGAGVDETLITGYLENAPTMFPSDLDTVIEPPIGDYHRPSDETIAGLEFLASPEGRSASFSDFIQRFNPSSSRFLQRGLERRFAPMQTAFETQSALGTLPPQTDPGRLAGGDSAVDFRQWMDRYGGAVPGQGTWQSMVSNVSNWLTGGQPTLGEDVAGQEYMRSPDNQFDLAFQSIAQQIPYHLRDAAYRTAKEKFQQFQVQNPSRMNEWLPLWQTQGQKWNPTMPAETTMNTTTWNPTRSFAAPYPATEYRYRQ